MKRIKLWLLVAATGTLALTACNNCKNCREYDGEDEDGNPKYAKESVKKCGDTLKDAQDAMTDPLIGTSHHKWNCD